MNQSKIKIFLFIFLVGLLSFQFKNKLKSLFSNGGNNRHSYYSPPKEIEVNGKKVLWPPKVGELFPDLQLKNEKGELISLSSLKGQTIFIQLIGMSSDGSQTFSGSKKYGPFEGVSPQENINDIETLYPKFSQGKIWSQQPITYVHLVLFNMQMKPPTTEDLKKWADHFHLQESTHNIILAGVETLTGPETIKLVPGMYLIDKEFYLRFDATGHAPLHDLYQDLFPNVENIANGKWDRFKLYEKYIGFLFTHEKFYLLEGEIEKQREHPAPFGTYLPRINSFYEGIQNEGKINESFRKPFLQRLEKWSQTIPDSATPLISLAMAHRNYAWEYRTGGFSNTVNRENWDKFESELQIAWNYLMKAKDLHPKDVFLYEEMIQVGNSLEHSKDRLEKYFREGVKQDPVNPSLYVTMSWALLPRWGGDKKAGERFAEEAVEITREFAGRGYYAIVAHNIYCYEVDKFYSDSGFEWPKIREAFEDLIKRFPDSITYKSNYLKMACFSKDKDSALKLLDSLPPWHRELSYHWKSTKELEYWKKWARGEIDYPGSQPIFNAARNGDTEEIRKLISLKQNINVQDPLGLTPLIVAIQSQHRDTALELIRNHADVNLLSFANDSALAYAIEFRYTEVVSALLKAGADPNKGSSVKMNPLQLAVQSDYDDIVRLLLNHKMTDVNLQNNLGENALHYAAAQKKERSFRLLSQNKNLNVNIQNAQKQSAIYFAARINYGDAVCKLLKLGADPNLSDVEGRTPLDYAAQNGALESLNCLFSIPKLNQAQLDSQQWTPIHYAAWGGQIDSVKFLISKFNYNLNAVDFEGTTPLFYAAQQNHLDMVKFLIQKGADPKIKNKYGEDTFDAARRVNNRELISYLSSLQ